ncbi:unnamed protein product [Lupinus luteus]|uniref:TMV resistance protein N n=1 Tax=Lupinus luteus TaxID=3873 RepID=A0AAV1XL93_LUPLU
MVGIYGIGGIGKTTVARAVYNLISDQYEGLCFLSDIREKAINKHGLVQLQETLLSEILEENDIKVGDVNRGIPIIKRRLQQKKVLLILDDVDKLVQLKALAGRYDWFGCGSKIIITTRDKQLLATHGITNLYEVKHLMDGKALELFSWHAFKSRKVDASYADISNRAVLYACGLPLALEVIGSHLFGKSLDECYSALDKYEKFPHRDIHEILKVSFDGLDEDEKGIFLDIACFFNTFKMDYVKEMLRAHSFHAENGIRVLADKSLLKISDHNCVRVHDLIQDMGREIVRQESTLDPGKRSRLWFDADIVHVLEENTGTGKIEVIMLDECNKEVQWSGKAFKKMKNLRILIIGDAIFSTGPQYLPNSLRVIDWSYYPSPSLPPTFIPKELMILKLPESCLQFFQPLKRFEFLWLINFEDCKFLTELPSLGEAPLLRRLCLDNCTKLLRIDESVGFLDNLVYLSAKGCTQLEILVPRVNLKALEVLDLAWCSSLKCFPEVLEKMDKIRVIHLDDTDIDKLPFSIGNLVGLERLYLRGCKLLKQLPNTIHSLPKVEVIVGYPSKRFRFFDKEKVCSESEISPRAMVVYNKGQGFTHLDVYSECLSSNISIQLCTPNRLEDPHFELLFKVLNRNTVTTEMEESIHFWFLNKFPKITLCFAREPDKYVNDNLVLYFKLNVVINGTTQFSSSCTYINTGDPIYLTQVFLCDLECKSEGVFSEHEWNQVEIFGEFEYPKPCDYEREITTELRNIKGCIQTNIYVDKEGNCKENIKLNNPMSDQPVSSSSSYECIESPLSFF